jgi:hypothetical protein
MICRRGGIRGVEVGAIRIDQNVTIVGVDAAVAAAFERTASRSDAREPHIHIRRDVRESADGKHAARAPRRAQDDSRPHTKPGKPQKAPPRSKAAKNRAVKRAHGA